MEGLADGMLGAWRAVCEVTQIWKSNPFLRSQQYKHALQPTPVAHLLMRSRIPIVTAISAELENYTASRPVRNVSQLPN